MDAEPSPPSPPTLSPPQRAVLACLTVYKVVLSPFLPGACRFLPSCSQYAREAVVTHGAIKGAGLALRRLSRCHPFGPSGLDPVPGRSPGTSTPGL
jgi:hypothetical protein